MAYAKDHTVAQCWEEYPAWMIRNHRGIEAYKRATLKKQTKMPSVTVFYGRTGTGKSHKALMEASESPDGITVGEKEFFSMITPASTAHTPWMDGYNGEKNVIIEDFEGSISFRIFLRMLDKYPNNMQVKGGSVQVAPDNVWITSNVHPRKWYSEEPTDTWGTGPLARRITKIKHMVLIFDDDQTGTQEGQES